MSESQPPPDRDGTPSSTGDSPDTVPTARATADAASGPPPGGSSASGSSAGGPYTGGPYTGGPYAGGPAAGTATGGSTSTAPGTSTTTGFFDSLRSTGLVRPDDRVAAGVAAAVARRLGIDPLLVRIGFVVLAIVGGVGVLAYGLGWLFLPQADGRIHAQALLTGSITAGTVGAGLTTIVGVGGFGPPWTWGDNGPDVGGLIAFAAIVFLIILFVIGNQQGWFGNGKESQAAVPGADPSGAGATRIDLSKPGTPSAGTPYTGTSYSGTPYYTGGPYSGSPYSGGSVPPAPPVPPAPSVPFTPPPPKHPRRRTAGPLGTLLAVGLALLAAGAVVVADSLDPLSVDVAVVAWATALAVLAACLLFLGLAGRRSGGLGFIAVVALIGMTVTWIASGVPDEDDVGQRRWVPTGQLDSYEYQLSAGQAVLDLRQLTPGTGRVDVEADVSLGELVVRVPDDLTVAVDVTNGIGDVTGVQEGQSIIGPDGPVDVDLTIDVSVGSLVLQEVSR